MKNIIKLTFVLFIFNFCSHSLIEINPKEEIFLPETLVIKTDTKIIIDTSLKFDFSLDLEMTTIDYLETNNKTENLVIEKLELEETFILTCSNQEEKHESNGFEFCYNKDGDIIEALDMGVNIKLAILLPNKGDKSFALFKILPITAKPIYPEPKEIEENISLSNLKYTKITSNKKCYFTFYSPSENLIFEISLEKYQETDLNFIKNILNKFYFTEQTNIECQETTDCLNEKNYCYQYNCLDNLCLIEKNLENCCYHHFDCSGPNKCFEQTCQELIICNNDTECNDENNETTDTCYLNNCFHTQKTELPCQFNSDCKNIPYICDPIDFEFLYSFNLNYCSPETQLCEIELVKCDKGFCQNKTNNCETIQNVLFAYNQVFHFPLKTSQELLTFYLKNGENKKILNSFTFDIKTNVNLSYDATFELIDNFGEALTNWNYPAKTVESEITVKLNKPHLLLENIKTLFTISSEFYNLQKNSKIEICLKSLNYYDANLGINDEKVTFLKNKCQLIFLK